MLGAQPVGPHDGKVDAQAAEGAERLGADGRLGDAADLSSQDPHRHPGPACEAGCGEDGGGEDGQAQVLGQDPGEGAHAGAGIEDEGGAPAQRGAVEEGCQGAGGDGLLGGGGQVLALGDGGLGQGEGRGDGAAVDLAQGADAIEDGEVTADGLDRDAVVCGESDDADPALTSDGVDDGLLALLGVHLTSSCWDSHPRLSVQTREYARSDTKGRENVVRCSSRAVFNVRSGICVSSGGRRAPAAPPTAVRPAGAEGRG